MEVRPQQKLVLSKILLCIFNLVVCLNARMQSGQSSTVFIAKDGRGQYGVHVSGFNCNSVKEEDLRQLFSKAGNVCVCKILMPQRIAFVKYLILSEAKSAISKFDGYQLGSGDGVLRVRPAYVSTKPHAKNSTKASTHGQPSITPCTQQSCGNEEVLSPCSPSANGLESNSDAETVEVSASLDNIQLVDTTNSDHSAPSHSQPESNATGQELTLDLSPEEFLSEDSCEQLVNNSDTYTVSQSSGSTDDEAAMTNGNFSESLNHIPNPSQQCSTNPTSSPTRSTHSNIVQHVKPDKTETGLHQTSSGQSYISTTMADKTQLGQGPSEWHTNMMPLSSNQLQKPQTNAHTGMQQCQYKYKFAKTPTINQAATLAKSGTPLNTETQINATVYSRGNGTGEASHQVTVNGAQLKKTTVKGVENVSTSGKSSTVAKINSDRPVVATMKVTDVVNFFKKGGYHQEAQFFEENEIDGRALVLLDLKALLHVMKLGPAIKLQSVIKLLID